MHSENSILQTSESNLAECSQNAENVSSQRMLACHRALLAEDGQAVAHKSSSITCFPDEKAFATLAYGAKQSSFWYGFVVKCSSLRDVTLTLESFFSGKAMPTIDALTLTNFGSAIFEKSDIPASVAKRVAESLVLANLKGHDSHGVIRIIEYVDWVKRGWVNPTGCLEVVREQPCILILDGNFGFGQVIGREALKLGIDKAKREGACILSLRRSGHLGRIGEFMEMAAEAGLVCFGLTNTHGGGVLVAPHGGCERRLSANPIAGGAPRTDGAAMIMDISTSTVAEGKIKVARNKGESLPAGLFVNGQGNPSTSPEEYYATPPGALLPMSAHKGFALSLFCEVFAGALTGAGCSKSGVDRVANGFMAFLLDPAVFSGTEFFNSEISALGQFVKSSRLMTGFDEIQLPGEPEANAQAKREPSGIPIDQTTWEKICTIAMQRQVPIPEVR